MSLVLIDLEMESYLADTESTRKKPQESPSGFKATFEHVSLGGQCHLDLNTVKAENTDQNGNQVNVGCDNAEEKTKCKKAKDAQKTKDARKTKDAQKTMDAKKTMGAKKANDAQKTKDAKKTMGAKKAMGGKKTKGANKEKDAKKKNERDTEKVVKEAKWGTLRRVVQALTLRVPVTSTSPLNSDDLGCDDISFDGHLFEYASHPPVIPKVDVPRLRLRPTLRERLYNIAHNFFRCGSMKPNNQYTLD
ncbi:cylicin-2-like [Haliotis rubra]|uniref:cylicin-2-like n=1 Tax=Haliotis rubra TaxID=36100 RepID=UPI001EE56AA0|nr:cylicin-2-like [Haliotis rubra]